MALSLTAEQKTLIEIFTIQEQYVIPPYQRPYSWGYEECKKLYDDIMGSFRNGKEDYFVGSIVTARNDNNTEEVEIIDGQQRLTTLLIFIKVLSLFEKHKKLESCLSFDSWDESKKFRIKSNVFEVDDKTQFEEILGYDKEKVVNKLQACRSKNGKIEEKKCSNKFEGNMVFFYSWLDYYITQEKGQLKEFIEFLLRKVYLLPVELNGKTVEEARAKALNIFETLNNRGIDLSAADTLKASLYERAIKANKEKIFIAEWKNFKDKCKQIGLTTDNVFRHYTHIVRGRNGKVTSEINLREFFMYEEYSPLINQGYAETLFELMQVVEIVQYIQDEKKKNSTVSRWLQVLELYTNQYPKHALIVYIFNYGHEEKGLVDFLKKLIRFSYFHGSTASIKFEIFSMIKKISDKKAMDISDYYQDDVDEEDYDSLGRLKNGYALLCYYLDEGNQVLPDYSMDKIIKLKELSLLGAGWSKELVEKADNSLGNLVVLDIPTKYISIDKKPSYYGTSKIEAVKSLSKQLKKFSYIDYQSRNDRLKSSLIAFFKGQ